MRLIPQRPYLHWRAAPLCVSTVSPSALRPLFPARAREFGQPPTERLVINCLFVLYSTPIPLNVTGELSTR